MDQIIDSDSLHTKLQSHIGKLLSIPWLADIVYLANEQNMFMKMHSLVHQWSIVRRS